MATTASTPQTLDATWPANAISVRTVAQQIVMESYERSSLSLEDYAAKVIEFAESGPEQARRLAIRKRIDILRDAWGPLLKKAIESWFQPAVVDAMLGVGRDHLDLSKNPAKNIWHQLSVAYKEPPVRTTPSDKADGEKYIEILKRAEPPMDLWMQMVEVLLQACNEILIWPDVITRNGVKKIKHRYACGDQAVIVTLDEDPTEIECVLILDEYTSLVDGKHCKYNLWTNEWHAQFERNSDGEIERVGYVPPVSTEEEAAEDPAKDNTAKNPYGGLRMTLIRLWPWGDCIFDATSGEDLVDLTLRGGEERVKYRYEQKMGGFKQLIASGLGIEKPPQQLLDPGAIATVEGQNINLQVVDWQTDMAAKQGCQMADELSAAASRGINPEQYKRTASYQTSFGARIAGKGLAEWRARNAMIMGRAEQSYKRDLCIVAKAHQIEDVPEPDVLLEVAYAPIDYPEDPAQQNTVDVARVGMGLESQVTLTLRDHPEWTEEQARDELKKRMADIAWVAEQKASRNIPNDVTNESRSAEQNGISGPAVRDGKPQPGITPPGQAGALAK